MNLEKEFPQTGPRLRDLMLPEPDKNPLAKLSTSFTLPPQDRPPQKNKKMTVCSKLNNTHKHSSHYRVNKPKQHQEVYYMSVNMTDQAEILNITTVSPWYKNNGIINSVVHTEWHSHY